MADKPSLALPRSESQQELAQQWRNLARMATVVAVLTSPAIFLWLRKFEGWSIGWSIFATFVAVAAFRGFIDIVLRRMIPWPSLFGTDDPRLREEDVSRRQFISGAGLTAAGAAVGLSFYFSRDPIPRPERSPVRTFQPDSLVPPIIGPRPGLGTIDCSATAQENTADVMT